MIDYTERQADIRAAHFRRDGTCVAGLDRRDACGAPAAFYVGQVNLCKVHFAPFEEAMLDQLRAERQRRAQEFERRQASNAAVDIVYYLQRRDGLIKIGHSRVLDNRIRTLRQAYGPLVLLATHGGGRAAERDQHDRFHDDRVEGEWFLPSDELLAHIKYVTERTAA